MISRQRQHRLLEDIPVAIGSATLGGQVLSFNGAMRQIFGYSTDELKKINVTHLYEKPKDRQKMIQQLKKSNSLDNFRARLKRKNGEVFDALLNIKIGLFDQKDILYVAVQDINRFVKTENDLRYKNRLIKDSIDNLPDVFYVFGLDEKLIFWNKTINQITGLNDQKILGMKASDFFTGKNKEIFQRALKENLETGTAKVTINYTTKSNKTIPFEFHSTLVKDDRNNPIAISGVGRNISEKIEWYGKAEEKTKKFVSNIMNTISEPLLILDTNLKVISANSSFHKAYGVSLQNTLGSFVYNLDDKQWNIPKLRQLLEEVLPEKKSVKNFIIEHEFGSLGRKVMSINASQIDSLQIILFTINDVTLNNESNLVKEALVLAQNIVDTFHSPFVVLDPDLKVIHVNHTFCKLFNINQSEIEKQPIYKLSLLWNIPELKQLTKFVRSKDKNFDKFQIQNDFPEIGKRTLLFNIQRISHDTAKTKNYILILIEDVTEQKESDEAKNSFLNIAAHDLRTPMTVIKGYAEMLLDGDFGNVNSLLKTPLSEISLASTRMLRIINDFLTISRLEQGHLSINIKKFDIAQLLKEVFSQIKVITKKKNLDFIIKKMPAKSYVFADPDKIQEVIFNLIDNAIKFTSTGSITVSVKKEKGMIVTSIADTGEGIPDDFQKNLFSKYFQVQGGRSVHEGKGTGLGLGLYISRLIVESCGGKIWVESKLNVGSKFSFSLPSKKQKHKT